MRLTKAQKARAKRAVIYDLEWSISRRGTYVGSGGDPVFHDDPAYEECERLLRVALAAVAKDGR